MKRLVSLALVVVGLAAIGITVTFSDVQTSQAASFPGPHPVITTTVENAPATRPRIFHGTTRAAKRAVLSFPMGGRLVSRPVELGDVLHAGALIGSLDPSPFRNNVEAHAAAVDEVRERLAQIERDESTTERLVRVGAAPPHDLEQLRSTAGALRARLTSTEAQLREARRARRDALLRAPFDGTIVEIAREPGEMVGAGTPVAVLAGRGQVEIEIEVPESLAGQLHEGAPAVVRLPLVGREGLAARIRDVSGSSGQPGRLFPVVVVLEDDDATRPGMTADVTLFQPLSTAFAVPVSAVVNPTGARAGVFVVREDHARRVDVEPSVLLGNRVLVLGQLRVGEEVVVGGQVGLVDGQEVEAHR